MKIFTVILNEWKNLYRNRSAIVLLSTLIILALFTIWQADKELSEKDAQRKQAIAHMREKFLGQGKVNPHSAAHYGHFVYKPVNVLGIVDEGINPFAGVSIRLEAHLQNEAQYSLAQDSSSIIRFGQLRLNILLQIIVPLLIIFFCFNSISMEKESGTLKLIKSQITDLKKYVWGKILAHSFLWWTFISVFFITIASVFIVNKIEQELIIRLAASLTLYSVYYFIVVSVSVYVSAISKNSANALIGLLCAWFLCTVLLPKITSNIGEVSTPMITKMEMEQRINEDNKNGINGHDPRNERTKRFEDSVLKAYNTDSAVNLSINLDGLKMQADEEYHNEVYDKHFTTFYEQVKSQGKITAASGVLNPFAALRNLSMGVSGTDIYHHFDFVTKAEDYRRSIIKTMNDEMAYGGSKTGDWDWTVESDYWEKIPDFKYEQPSIAWALRKYRWELVGILFWLCLSVILIQLSGKAINVI